ncbi:MAG: sodium/proline symporter [Acidobacteria bacterium]|uniref:Sodium/proline symporter n=1 Tax=Candidatus Polarisedimenticola svalbardensis TaxID=2886004 RepID=A0A8J6XRR8_9BACT|nr:sodium/proline symporter [Candidatus Polarisedimenticola svalbardensis]
MMSRTAAILATLVAYKLILIGIGVWASRRTRSAEDYYLGGRRLGPWVAALSASASSSSAWTLLGVSGFAFGFGLSAIWLFPGCVGGFLLNWYVLAPRLREAARRNGSITVTGFLAGPVGTPYRKPIIYLASAIVIVFLTLYVASQFQGAGKTFAETFDIGATEAILLGSAIVVLYTLIGGFWAVSVTDTLQGLVMAATSVALPLAALVAVGGPMELFRSLQAVPIEGFASPFGNMGAAAAIGFIAGLLGIGLGYPGQPHVVNRFMALRAGDSAMITARRVAMTWAVLVYTGMITLGLCGRILLPYLADREVVFLAATDALFPPILAGVMVAAVLSAIMSTADSQLLVAGSALTHDLGIGGGDNRKTLLWSRITVLSLSIAAILTALYGPQQIFSPVLVAWSALGAAFGPLLLVTVIKGPVPPGKTLAAMATGLILAITGVAIKSTGVAGTWGPVLERVVPFTVALLVAAWPVSGTSNHREKNP